jgi:RHS repeat-associated protein
MTQHGLVTLAYDGDGNRVSETEGGVTTNYLVDTQNPTGYAQVVDELQSGTVARTYSFGLERISETQSISGTSATSFYGYDGHGSVRQLTNSTGAVTDTYDYDAFGNIVNSTGSTPNNYLFAGEQYDPALSLYYNRARYLNVDTGRFWIMDTDEGHEEEPITLHSFLFAGADPVNNADPSGNDFDIGISDTISGMATLNVGVVLQLMTALAGSVGANRPSSTAFWESYLNYDFFSPKNVWERVGGSLGKWGMAGPQAPQETCATRVSYGLNYSGAAIDGSEKSIDPGGFVKNSSSVSYKGVAGDDNWYIIRAVTMNKYLTATWGKPEYTPKTSTELDTVMSHLDSQNGQIAIFARKTLNGPYGHSGVLKKGYQDPYVNGELPVDVWMLP